MIIFSQKRPEKTKRMFFDQKQLKSEKRVFYNLLAIFYPF